MLLCESVKITAKNISWIYSLGSSPSKCSVTPWSVRYLYFAYLSKNIPFWTVCIGWWCLQERKETSTPAVFHHFPGCFQRCIIFYSGCLDVAHSMTRCLLFTTNLSIVSFPTEHKSILKAFGSQRNMLSRISLVMKLLKNFGNTYFYYVSKWFKPNVLYTPRNWV